MVRLAYLQRSDGDWLNENIFALSRGLRLMGIETRGFEFDDLDRLPIGREIMVCGGVYEVRRALQALGLSSPKECSGLPPEPLLPFYGRKVWSATLLDAISLAEVDGPVFIKPLHCHKAFPGHVVTGTYRDQIITAGFYDSFEVLCSEPVNFVSEYRGFVHHGELIGLRHYKGDCTQFVDCSVVRAAVAAWRGPVSYSVDFGATDDGRTLVVEINDAFALGAYGLPSLTYTRFVMDRWEEMVSAKPLTVADVHRALASSEQRANATNRQLAEDLAPTAEQMGLRLR